MILAALILYALGYFIFWQTIYDPWDCIEPPCAFNYLTVALWPFWAAIEIWIIIYEKINK